MYDGEIFTINGNSSNFITAKSAAGLLNLSLNKDKNLVRAWLNTTSNTKILLHFIDCMQSYLQLVEYDLFKSGTHIAICSTLTIEDELLLIEHGFNAALLSNESPYTLIKKMTTVIDGNLCFSNEACSRFILNTNRSPLNKDRLTLIFSTTKKEKEVISLVCSGMSNEQVANKLNVSINTIKMHLQNIYKKAQIKNRGQLLLTYGQNFVAH
ncbi:LuxR C-terminal-related transcriptional regulator [Shewanella eurypsychrophilus]|uniref:LuxR C-terminal-related transcriptional regulator n=1 Tax=Shewanella eurypsychrophilus TaxID=2593656 RepID=A0ABX6VCA1_9GAMM|nr:MULTISPECIES: LuxR C-terminal-related transcriptional regulator [Shewanella]QFU24332.1 DNA-binding response regulator [Shewanella sp. YLB-09]QPG59532.1 LuxR C-terminal-related transcriptional regulator [Shewanella eurypsychrophilus]